MGSCLDLMLSDSVQRAVSTVCGPHHHDTRFIYFIFKLFLTDPQSSISDYRSSILDPGFSVNLEVFLIKIVLFLEH